jgi:hypothetical protein
MLEFGNMDGDLRMLTVEGVVGDVRESSLETPARPKVACRPSFLLSVPTWVVFFLPCCLLCECYAHVVWNKLSLKV